MQSLLLSIALFPPIEYMALLLFHDNVRIEAHENYIKQSYRNRYYILGPNGNQMLQVPVAKKRNQKTLITDVEISKYDFNPLIHIRSLETAYNKAPFYLHYKDEVNDLIQNCGNSLWDFALSSISLCSIVIGKKIKIPLTSSFVSKPKRIDLRYLIHPKKGSILKNGNSNVLRYNQVFSDRYDFVYNLSILDLLFNEGPGSLHFLERVYDYLLKSHY